MNDHLSVDVVYHADPLCGWCFAIAEELAEARRILGGRANWTIAMGGLVVGDRVRPVAHDEAYLRAGLAQVERLSGRSASAAYFDDIVGAGTWVSDSEPVCRAVMVAIELAGTDAGFIATHFLSDRLYVEGREPDTLESLRALADRIDVDRAVFVARWDSTAARTRLADHWDATRRSGLRTYPSIAVPEGRSVRVLLTGFATSSEIVDAVRSARPTQTPMG